MFIEWWLLCIQCGFNRREFIRFEDNLLNLFHFKYFIVTVRYTVPGTCTYISLYSSNYLYIEFAIQFQLPVHTVRYTFPVTCTYISLYSSSYLYIQFAIQFQLPVHTVRYTIFLSYQQCRQKSPKHCDTANVQISLCSSAVDMVFLYTFLQNSTQFQHSERCVYTNFVKSSQGFRQRKGFLFSNFSRGNFVC